MIKKQKITKLDDILKLFIEQEYESSINRYRSSFMYRGLPNVNFKLRTSLYRNCGTLQMNLEKSILRNFAKYAAIDNPELESSIWQQMIIGQHHNLPTRLLDWTYSPLVGLHFATSGEALSDMESNDCVLWKIDINEFNSLLPVKYKNQLKEEQAYLFTIDMLERIVNTIGKYDDDMSDKAMILLEPPSIDQRIINQYSYFSIVPGGIVDIEDFMEKRTNNTVKYVIDKSLKWRIRDMLDQMNINERTIYPGLDGLSDWLKRHYYVKSDYLLK